MNLHQNYKKYSFQIIVFLIATALAIFLLKQNLDLQKNISRINWPYFSISIFTQLGYLYFMMRPFRRLLETHHSKLTLTRWLFLTSLCNSINLSTPYRLDLLVRYLLLKKWIHLSIVAYGQISFIFSILSLCVGAFLLLLFSLLQKETLQILNWHAFVLPCLGLLGLAVVTVFIKKAKFGIALIEKFKHELLAIPHPRRIIALSITDFLSARVCAFIGFIIVTHAMHLYLPLMFLALASVALFLSQLFVITPGNIGVTESVLGLLTFLFFKDLSLGIQISFFYRFSALASSIVLTLLFWLKRD